MTPESAALNPRDAVRPPAATNDYFLGQGFGAAQGFASAGRTSLRFDAFCLTGDGELQEGPIWEAEMYAGQKHLDNRCVMVDRNNGQLDLANRMIEAFGLTPSVIVDAVRARVRP